MKSIQSKYAKLTIFTGNFFLDSLAGNHDIIDDWCDNTPESLGALKDYQYLNTEDDYMGAIHQIKLVRNIINMINNDYYYLIFTRSYYIIKEVNTLIMLGYLLNNNKAKAEMLMRKYGYSVNEIITDVNKIVVYDILNIRPTKCKIDEYYGVTIPSIHKLTDKMDKIQKAAKKYYK